MEITIKVSGGVVQEVDIPKKISDTVENAIVNEEITVVVIDYDNNHTTDINGERCSIDIYEQED